jgi:hypothetical protein
VASTTVTGPVGSGVGEVPGGDVLLGSGVASGEDVPLGGKDTSGEGAPLGGKDALGEEGSFSKVYTPIDEAQIITTRITPSAIVRFLFIEIHSMCIIIFLD